MSNTKKMLIEVARQLFAANGKKDVTMNDIAEASKKGRRTLYTYFNNKEEIYKAVIDKELDQILERLKVVSAQKTEPDEKLVPGWGMAWHSTAGEACSATCTSAFPPARSYVPEPVTMASDWFCRTACKRYSLKLNCLKFTACPRAFKLTDA